MANIVDYCIHKQEYIKRLKKKIRIWRTSESLDFADSNDLSLRYKIVYVVEDRLHQSNLCILPHYYNITNQEISELFHCEESDMRMFVEYDTAAKAQEAINKLYEYLYKKKKKVLTS